MCIIALLIIFFFVPLITDHWSISAARAGAVVYTAQVSPSFYLLGCGAAMNIHSFVLGPLTPPANVTYAVWLCS